MTREEAAAWEDLAAQHGHLDDNGQVQMGRFVVENRRVLPNGDLEAVIRFVTPLVAGASVEPVAQVAAPILFDRNERGEISISGRLWDRSSDAVIENDGDPIARALASVRDRFFLDVRLPGDTDTVALTEEGTLTVYEAIPPGAQCTVRVFRKQ